MSKTIKLCCPHCGGSLGLPDADAGLTRLERDVLDILRERPGKWYSARAISDILYADRPDGGPLNAHNNIAVHVSRIRKKAGVNVIESADRLGYRVAVDMKAQAA